ncbi:MAG: TRAP transporter large permease subunit [Alphaproteobacteria bacterium]
MSEFDTNLIFVVLMFGTFIALLFTGYPLAFVLGGVAVIFAVTGEILNAYFDVWVDANLGYLRFAVNRIFGVMSSYGLVPVPMFIFMGLMLDKSGIANELLRSLQMLLRSVPGGLALAVTIIGTVLAASTGIIGASVVLLTTLALPTMLRDRYQPELAVGTIAASGCLGILIPPSIMLILMADQMNLSVGDLFMGAVFPGLVLSGLYVVYIGVLAFLRPHLAPPLQLAPGEEAVSTAAMLFAVFKAMIAPSLLIMAVLGSIFLGIASPTEAAGVGAMGATLLALLNRKLDMATLKDVMYGTAKTTSFIFAAFAGATTFAVVLRGVGGDQVIEEGLLSLPFGPEGVLAVMLIVVFLLGFILDWVEITLIVLPLFAPVVPALGFDPVWFTILVAVCLQTSFLTPPVGFALFYLKSVAPPQITVMHLYRGIIPFVILQVIGLGIVIYYPTLVTWLPSVAY